MVVIFWMLLGQQSPRRNKLLKRQLFSSNRSMKSRPICRINLLRPHIWLKLGSLLRSFLLLCRVHLRRNHQEIYSSQSQGSSRRHLKPTWIQKRRADPRVDIQRLAMPSTPPQDRWSKTSWPKSSPRRALVRLSNRTISSTTTWPKTASSPRKMRTARTSIRTPGILTSHRAPTTTFTPTSRCPTTKSKRNWRKPRCPSPHSWRTRRSTEGIWRRRRTSIWRTKSRPTSTSRRLRSRSSTTSRGERQVPGRRENHPFWLGTRRTSTRYKTLELEDRASPLGATAKECSARSQMAVMKHLLTSSMLAKFPPCTTPILKCNHLESTIAKLVFRGDTKAKCRKPLQPP